MKRRHGVISVVLLVLVVAGLFYRHEFRCIVRRLPRTTETICFSWGHPRSVRVADMNGRPVSFASLFREPPYTDTEASLTDLFGSGRISQIVRVAPGDEYGDMVTEEFSTEDNERFDLLIVFRGRALVAGFSVTSTCSKWLSEAVTVPGRSVLAAHCVDADALRPVSRAEALRMVSDLPLPLQTRDLAVSRIAAATDRLAPGSRM